MLVGRLEELTTLLQKLREAHATDSAYVTFSPHERQMLINILNDLEVFTDA